MYYILLKVMRRREMYMLKDFFSVIVYEKCIRNDDDSVFLSTTKLQLKRTKYVRINLLL